ncbi:unnamed protein product [Peronospora destructor]|uniref:Uncharacterized protein n=1 Tax=Peronospora destructor TaxID=86335 RepID=A0AAV0UVN8_9STRA|nr:unnamed protein product [Peronospora destructor]
MDILNVDMLPPPGLNGDNEAGEDPTLLRLSSNSLQNISANPNLSHSSCSGVHRRRKKIGKGIQLILLRKYVQCAKQFNRLPDRLTTEQLLEQGYDEFYYQGGNLNEPRLSYTAFLKLVRNRRSEVVRLTRGNKSNGQRGSIRHCYKEQMEIRALIDELEHVRHAQPRGTLDYGALSATAGSENARAVITDTSVPLLSDASSSMGDTGTDGGVSAGDLSTAETYSSIMSGTGGKNDDVIVTRSKLDLMLRMAQETLMAQKKILEEVRAMEQRIAAIH